MVAALRLEHEPHGGLPHVHVDPLAHVLHLDDVIRTLPVAPSEFALYVDDVTRDTRLDDDARPFLVPETVLG